MKAYPLYPNRKILNLNRLWSFTFLGKSIVASDIDINCIDFDDFIDVPMAYDATPKYQGKQGLFAYRTTLEVKPGKRSLLKIGGMGMWNAFYLDGKLLSINRLPYSGVEIELPASDVETRTLTVLSDNRLNLDTTPLFDNMYDFYSYGGFFRDVELHILEDTWLDRGRIKCIDLNRGEVEVTLSLGGIEPDFDILAKDIELNLTSGNFKNVKIEPQNLKFSNGSIRFLILIPNPVLWSTENPYLYELEIKFMKDSIIERFGLRTVQASGKDILLNNKPVKLLGYCRHEAHPQFGPALPFSQLVQDVQLLKDLGCNFVRGSHYPQDQRFLDLCDLSGILVFEESLGWGNSARHFEREDFCSDQVKQTELMVKNSFNHPSVIIWGFLNEGNSHYSESEKIYTLLAKVIKDEDSSRLITYATNHPLEDKFLDLCDIISVNTYPGWYERHDNDPSVEETRPLDKINPRIDLIKKHMESIGQGSKPLIISEIGAGAIYGWRDSIHAHWSENYQADFLEVVCNRVVKDSEIAGVSLWQFCDCRTYQTGRAIFRPRAFNNKGTVDEYRRPKMAYDVVKRVFKGE